MRSLSVARDACDALHPGLLPVLERIPFAEREAAGSPVMEIYRDHRGPGLLVPEEYGGPAADPLTAVRVQRALASVSPSLGVATVMHHFTIAMLFALAEDADRLNPTQLKMMSRVAGEGLLLASGWAEGRTDQNILLPAVTATAATDGGYLVTGAKKPCSLSGSMDVLTASVAISEEGGSPRLALLLIPADSDGITVHPFWSTPILAATQSNEVRLKDVYVPEELVITSTPNDQTRLDDLQTAGFTWFELLTTAAYTGVASTLVAKVLDAGRGSPSERAVLAGRMDTAVLLTEGAARALADGVRGDEAVSSLLISRYAVQDLLGAVVDQAVEMLGGMAFIRSADVSYLASAVRALAFHPPSRASVAAQLVDYQQGEPLRLS
jgi:alkylation response protein AidB-like acyl-CoA dehydrogenase